MPHVLEQPYMQHYEVVRSMIFGNTLAQKLIDQAPVKPRFAASIRHMVATLGREEATHQTAKLLNSSISEADRHITFIMRSKPDDITSPYYSR